MGSYTAISDASRSIIALLKSTMVPEPIKNPEAIGLCSPADKGGISLGLYLYNIQENVEALSQEKIKLDKTHFKEPSQSFYLYYLLFTRSEAELMTRIADEQRILGRAIQQLNDYRRIPKEYLVGTLSDNDEQIDIQGIHLQTDEKARIWSLFQQPYCTSFYYKAGPVFIESDVVKSYSRVQTAEIIITAEKGSSPKN